MGGALLAGAALLGLTACDPVARLDLSVTTTVDLVDAVPGDGVCEATPGAGDCSLRAAVMEANATPAETAVRVELEAGSEHVLTRQVGCGEWDGNDAALEDLDVTRDLTVIGNGAVISTAGGDWEDPTFGTLPCLIRVFEHHAGRLRIEQVDLVGETFRYGAALHNWATAELVDVYATGTGSAGGGVVVHNRGTLTLVRTRVAHGGVLGSPQFPNGSPWAGLWTQSGSLVLLDSEVASNTDLNRYGSSDFAGIHVASGDATLIQSAVTGHRASVFTPAGYVTVHGDGIDARGPVTLVRSTVVDNGVNRDVVGTATVSVSGSILGACGTVVSSLGHNADTDGSCLGVGQPTDLVATPTTFERVWPEMDYVPAAGSAVLDAIPPATAELCDDGWPTDLRGAPRPWGAGCDIGAIERQPSDT